ncbi:MULTISPECIES: RimK/LysX family protein [unclassified Neptuniibacter]|uniref:ATP-dependent zinc protease family protein n=1 Tax=unclassified Neptuniibacter TaxID=2630693 RepID=UPI0025D49BB5|nr:MULTISPECIES: RimK/LysX family protein [unclassified Neptuniibacter]|tara:strand:- start:3242 stop:3670 length:429 start_codon:yes stop_codon:yes gene_type:complete
MNEKMVVGSIEVCDLPDMGILSLPVRVDTGAKTSSLHVDNLEKFTQKGKPWVRFDIHPDVYNIETVTHCESALHDLRRIKSSNGASEERYIIKTLMNLGDKSWNIELSLTDRSDMSYLMLLGRQGMGERVLVDPSQTFMLEN